MQVMLTYNASLTAAGVMDYDDMLSTAVSLLEVPAVRKHVGQRFSNVLVDEFQVSWKHQVTHTVMCAPPPLSLWFQISWFLAWSVCLGKMRNSNLDETVNWLVVQACLLLLCRMARSLTGACHASSFSAE